MHKIILVIKVLWGYYNANEMLVLASSEFTTSFKWSSCWGVNL